MSDPSNINIILEFQNFSQTAYNIGWHVLERIQVSITIVIARKLILLVCLPYIKQDGTFLDAIESKTPVYFISGHECLPLYVEETGHDAAAI